MKGEEEDGEPGAGACMSGSSPAAALSPTVGRVCAAATATAAAAATAAAVTAAGAGERGWKGECLTAALNLNRDGIRRRTAASELDTSRQKRKKRRGGRMSGSEVTKTDSLLAHSLLAGTSDGSSALILPTSPRFSIESAVVCAINVAPRVAARALTRTFAV